MQKTLNEQLTTSNNFVPLLRCIFVLHLSSVSCLLCSVFAVRHPVDLLLSSLVPRPSSLPFHFSFSLFSLHTPLNFYSHSPQMLRPIIFCPFSLLLIALHLTLLYSFSTIYLTKLTARWYIILHHKPSLRLSVQPSNHLLLFLYHTPLNFYYHSPRLLRPIIFTPLNSQNPGFTKNTIHQTKTTKDYVRNYQLFMQNKPKQSQFPKSSLPGRSTACIAGPMPL